MHFLVRSPSVPDLKRDLNASQKKKETPEERAKRLERSKEKREKTRQSRRDETPTEIVEHAIVETECAQCGGSLEAADDLSPEVSEEYEYVPARVIRREHHRERKVCKCGCFAIAAAPERLVEGGLYGPGLHAHVVIAKCADSLPLDRQARAFSRAHVPLSKSTLCDLFHRSAEVLSPLSQRILELIASSSHVNADETSLKVQATGECRRAFVWDFIATHDNHTMVAYRFSADRSGQTPIKVLGDSTGVLQVDGFTGYNQVTTPDKRERAGCWAHARRKYFGALDSAPDEAQWAIDKIREIYEVEYLAAEKKVIGKPQHLTLRKAKSKELVEELMTWADDQKPKHRPKSPLGAALTYTLNQRKSLERFLTDPKIRLDNNTSDSSRLAAKTFSLWATTRPARTWLLCKLWCQPAWPTRSTRRPISPMSCCELGVIPTNKSMTCCHGTGILIPDDGVYRTDTNLKTAAAFFDEESK